MAYDHEEQEQLAQLKAFWAKYGTVITALFTLIALTFAGYRGWQYFQQKQAMQAAVVYEALAEGAKAKDMAQVKEASGVLLDKYKRTAYAQMGALIAASSYVEAKDVRAAKAQLEWVIEHARDDMFEHLARVRLAGILLDEKAYDAGLKLLAAEPPKSFAGQYADRRGDLFAAQNKAKEAQAEYAKALDLLDKNDPLRQLVELKRDALGVS